MKSRFWLHLGNQSKQAGNEGNLPSDVPFFHSVHLSLTDHIHTLLSSQGIPCRFKRIEAQSRFHQPFDEPMVLFDTIVEICALA